MSMRFRLNALIIGILGLTLLSFVALTVWKARARVQTENANIIRLAKDFLDVSVAGLAAAPDRQARLNFMLIELSAIRHLSVRRPGEPEAPKGIVPNAVDALTTPPQWFYRLVHSDSDDKALAVRFAVPDYGTLVITPDPSYEIAEIWDSIVSLAMSGSSLALIAIAFASWIIEQTLRPLREVGQALGDIEAGQYAVNLASSGPPEVASLTLKLNTVAARLKRKQEENRELAQKVITIQDQERRDLARELHDEMGPYLFAIRAIATKLKSGLMQTPGPAFSEQCDTMLARIDEVQQVNRRVLQKLRPAGLDELGLKTALEAFLTMCKSSGQAMDFAMTVDAAANDLDRTAQLTIYRIVQEAVTNAMRHARAQSIDIDIELNSDGLPGETAPMRTAGVCIVVADDGTGIKQARTSGSGILGIEERVRSLGGELVLTDRTGGGTEVRASFPVTLAFEPAHPLSPMPSL